MALQFAILTALSEREASGFELAKRFDRAFGYFWSASHQQIYRELDRLNTSGLIAEVPQPERRERGQPKRFSVTPIGFDALGEWLRKVDEPTPPREALVVKMRAAAAVGDLNGVRAVVAHHLEVHEQTYAKYKEIEERDFSVIEDAADTMRFLVLKGGIATERAQANWCREVLDTMDRIRSRSAAHSG